VRSEKPHVLCVDVGGPAKIGWADDEGRDGTGADLDEALDRLAALLLAGRRVALGFEAPIWTPVRVELARITSCRGGLETMYNRAWSAGAGTGALGAALALMPWCLTRIAKGAGPIATTIDLQRSLEGGGLFLWEAFVSGVMKVAGRTHHDDARLARARSAPARRRLLAGSRTGPSRRETGREPSGRPSPEDGCDR
jgi:hypothetical protein